MRQREVATFAGGCFWCIESAMNRLKGVEKAISGYTGGDTTNPSYREVCSGTTGHAEAVEVTYDPSVIDYQTLLTVFFTMHDPTTLNRQGADIGTQYRSAIFYHNPEQKKLAGDYIQKLEQEKVFGKPIVTRLDPAGTFYIAEDYHQDYYNQNRDKNSYCTAVIDPKISKLRKSFSHLLKS